MKKTRKFLAYAMAAMMVLLLLPVTALAATEISAINITGDKTVGSELTASITGGESTPTYTWYRSDGNNTDGTTNLGTGDKYRLTVDDIGKYVYVVVAPGGSDSLAASISSGKPAAAYGPITARVASLTGGDFQTSGTPPVVSTAVTVNSFPNGSTAADYSFTWQVGGTTTTTSASYTPVAPDATKALTVTIRYTAAAAALPGDPVTLSLGTVTAAATPAVSITMGGRPEVGESYAPTITFTPDDVKNHAKYQWSYSTTSGGTYSDIAGATSAAYTPTSTQQGGYLKLTVINSDAVYGTFSASANTADTVAAASTDDYEPYRTDAYTPLYNNNRSIWLYPSGGLAYYATLSTTTLSSTSSDYIALKNAAGSGTILLAYDVRLYNTGSLYAPYTLTFNLGPTYANRSYTVLHKLSSGLIEKFSVTSNAQGRLTVTTSELSPFMVVYGGSTGGTIYVPPTDVPKTGGSNVSGMLGLMLAIAAVVAAAFLGRAILRRRQEQQ